MRLLDFLTTQFQIHKLCGVEWHEKVIVNDEWVQIQEMMGEASLQTDNIKATNTSNSFICSESCALCISDLCWSDVSQHAICCVGQVNNRMYCYTVIHYMRPAATLHQLCLASLLRVYLGMNLLFFIHSKLMKILIL